MRRFIFMTVVIIFNITFTYTILVERLVVEEAQGFLVVNIR